MADIQLSALINKFLQETTLDATEQNSIREDLGLKTTDAVTFKNLVLTGLSLTGSQATSSLDIAATWNTTGTVTGIKLNATDTASNSASLLMDLQVGGVSKFKISKDGFAHVAYGVSIYTGSSTSGNRSLLFFDGGNGGVVYSNKIYFAPSGVDVGGGADLFLSRVAAATIQLGMNHATTPTSQTIKAHDVTTGTGASLTLKGGTGSVANGHVILDGGNRAANIGDASTTHSMVGGDSVSLVALEPALNDLGGKINSITAALIAHGLMAAP